MRNCVIFTKRRLRNLYRFFRPIQVKGTCNTIFNNSKIGHNFTITIIGNNNIVEIGKDCLLTNTHITITGDNNHLIIEDTARFMGPCKITMEGNTTVHFGKNCGIRGVELSARNGKIEIGELTMTSYGIVIRNHDSHKVLDKEGRILNPSRDVIIGKHVWIAQNASILKGVSIGDNSIIGFGSIVTKSCGPGCILAGNPAKVVKEDILWDY